MQKILIIDDDAQTRGLVQRALAVKGFATIEAASGEAGIQLARTQMPDLIISDVHMEEVDGYAALAELHNDPATATIPFILMTGRADQSGMRRGMELGADDYLAKPFSIQDLLAAVDARLKKQQTLRQQSEETKARLVAILEATPDLVSITDAKNERVLYLNRAGRTLLEIGPAEDIMALCSTDFQPVWASESIQREAIPAAMRGGVWSGETALLSRTGREFPVSQVVIAHKTPNGTVEYLSTIARDITERKRDEQSLREAKERLQTLSHLLLQVQETERRNLARELHDEIGQALTALKLNLRALQRFPDPTTFAQRLEDSVGILDGLLKQVRDLSLNLRPPLLDDLGLVAALRWYVDQQAQRAGLRAHLVADSSAPRLDPALETACFRAAQEAVTNVVRHARAKTVAIELHQDAGLLHLIVRDDGIGFDPVAARKRAQQGASLGLLGIEERATLAGGRVEYKSALQNGTEVHAYFPLTSGPSNPDSAASTNLP